MQESISIIMGCRVRSDAGKQAPKLCIAYEELLMRQLMFVFPLATDYIIPAGTHFQGDMRFTSTPRVASTEHALGDMYVEPRHRLLDSMTCKAVQ